ncbi:MAG: DinB family protein [Candidatus Thorarchaeota archaeon]
MTEEIEPIARALVNQYTSVWKMLQNAITEVPDERWHDGVGQWYFSQTAYHIIETAQFYLGSDPDAMQWGARAGIVWDDIEDIENEVLPRLNKELVNSYLQEIEQKWAETLKSASDSNLLETDGFHWFSSILDKLIYLLRHTNYHVGELNRALREWDLSPARWG